jgi:hypothetical protein
VSASDFRLMSERIDKAVRETQQTIRRCKEIMASVDQQSAIERASQATEIEAIEFDRRKRLNRIW